MSKNVPSLIGYVTKDSVKLSCLNELMWDRFPSCVVQLCDRDVELSVCLVIVGPQPRRKETWVSEQRCLAVTLLLQSLSLVGVAACWIRYFPSPHLH